MRSITMKHDPSNLITALIGMLTTGTFSVILGISWLDVWENALSALKIGLIALSTGILTAAGNHLAKKWFAKKRKDY